MKSIISVIYSIICVVLTISLCWVVSHSVNMVQNTESILAGIIFENTVKSDKDIRLSGHDMIHHRTWESIAPPDTLLHETAAGVKKYKKEGATSNITVEEKEHIASQFYLLKKNPVRVTVLDTLFQNALQAGGVKARSAIYYQAQLEENRDSAYSSSDSSFYKTAIALSPVVLESKPLQFRMEFQGYVTYPFSYLLGKVPNLWLFITLYIAGMLLVTGLFLRQLKRRKQKGEPGINLLVKRMEKNTPLVAITDKLLMDQQTGEFIWEDEVVCQLKEYRFKLFLLLLAGKNFYQDYPTIKTEVWNNKSTDNETVSKTIIRLRKDLEKLPVQLTIQSIRGNGYQLLIPEKQEIE